MMMYYWILFCLASLLATSYSAGVQVTKTSWWICNGCAESCLQKVVVDVELNLNASTCSCPCGRRPPIPLQIERLSDLSKLRSSGVQNIHFDPSSSPFDEEMELLANVIVQKSRYCVFDVDAFATLWTRVYHIIDTPNETDDLQDDNVVNE